MQSTYEHVQGPGLKIQHQNEKKGFRKIPSAFKGVNNNNNNNNNPSSISVFNIGKKKNTTELVDR